MLMFIIMCIIVNICKCGLIVYKPLTLDKEIESEVSDGNAYYEVIPNNERNYLIIQTANACGDRYTMYIASSKERTIYDYDFMSVTHIRGVEVLVIPQSYFKELNVIYLRIHSQSVLKFSIVATFTNTRVLSNFNWKFNKETSNVLYTNDFIGEFNAYITHMKYSYHIPLNVIDNSNHIIIGIEYEYFITININAYIGNYSVLSTNVYFPRKFILYPSDIKKKCSTMSSSECVLFIDVSISKEVIQQYHNVLYNINIKDEEPFPLLLPDNTPKRDLNIGNTIQYYYILKSAQHSVEIILNNNKGSGRMFAFSISDNEIQRINKWSDIITYYNDKQYHEYDINTNRIIINKIPNYTYYDIVIIGVISNDDYNNKEDHTESIYEYSIVYHKYYDYVNSPISHYGIIQLLSNEIVNAVIEQNTNTNVGVVDIGKRNIILFQYTIPKGVYKLFYDILHCNSCYLYTSHYQRYTDITDNNILSFERYDNIYTSISNEISLLHEGNAMLIGVACSEIEDNNYTKFAIRLNPLYAHANTFLTLHSNENYLHCNTFINNNNTCNYALPVYTYDKTEELIISASTSNDVPISTVSISLMIYDYEYSDVLYKDSVHRKWTTRINQTKGNKNNYLIINSVYFNKKDSLLYITITENSHCIFDVHFTFIKRSHKSILTPNKKSLIFIDKSSSKLLSLPYITNNNNNNNVTNQTTTKPVSEIIIKHIKGNAILNINNKRILLDQTHSVISMLYKPLYTRNNDIYIHSERGVCFYIIFNTKPKEQLSLISEGKVHQYIIPLNTFPIMTYIINPSEEYDTTFNIAIHGVSDLNINAYVNWELKGFLLNSYYITKRIGNSNLPPQYHSMINGYYDSIMMYKGVIQFKCNDIKQYNTQYNKTLLLRFYDKNNNHNIPLHLLNEYVFVNVVSLKTNEWDITLPQYDYFYSQIQSPSMNGSSNNKAYNVYKLVTINAEHKYMYIEYSGCCHGRSNFAFKYEYTPTICDNGSIYHNDTDVNIIEESTAYGKRSVILKLKNKVNTLYIIIFPDNEHHYTLNKTDSIHFVVKYYSFMNYNTTTTLYEMVSIINDTSLYLTHEYNNKMHLKWNDVNNVHITNVYYYIKVYEQNQFKYENEINSICLCGKTHLLNVTTTLNKTFFVFDNFPQGDVYITVIARMIKENNFEENIIAYTPIRVVNGKVIGIKKRYGYTYMIIKCLYLIIVIVVGGMICIGVLLYIYKVIRTKQVKNTKYKGFNRGKRNGMMKDVPKNLSWVIEKDNYII